MSPFLKSLPLLYNSFARKNHKWQEQIMSDEQIQRRERTIKILNRMGLPCPSQGLITQYQPSPELPSPVEIINRCLAVSICAVKGETGNQAMVEEMVTEFSARDYFTEGEQFFINDPRPLQSDLIKFSWMYESVHIFLWVLGYLGRILPPGRISDVVMEMAMIWKMGRDEMIERARLRPVSDILDAADLYRHLQWAAEDLRSRGQKNKRIIEDVVMVRDYTLYWLMNHPQEPWQPYREKT